MNIEMPVLNGFQVYIYIYIYIYIYCNIDSRGIEGTDGEGRYRENSNHRDEHRKIYRN